MAATVDALLPLSFLEAVRDVDTPEGEYDSELVAELKNKRFGLSDTVYTQIRRYTDAVKRNQSVAHEEAVALARLIGRRQDAENVFRAAGAYLALETYQSISPVLRQLMRILPSLLARPIALRRARRITKRYLNASLNRNGSFLTLEVPESVTIESAPRAAGCSYYGTFLRELMRLLIGGAGPVEHVRCASRGEDACEWRADWRPMDRAAMAASEG
ncbi:MAG: hypothetical protein ACRENI_03420 [Gemmatimonadaceae bacterium]